MGKPNILFILIDDLGWRDLSCYGSAFYETPNLDRLAREGVLFTNAYASCPVCSPTRASIMSGKYPARVGITNWIPSKDEGKLANVPYLHYLPLEEKSLASSLREQGYQTWHVGKWHLGDEPFYPQHHGFDVNVGGCHWGAPKTYVSPYGIPGLPDGPAGEYLTDRLTDEAIRLIRSRGEKPFFLNLWHYAVHVPIQAPEALVEKYRAKAKAMQIDRVDPLVVGDWFGLTRKLDQRIVRRVLQSDPRYAAMVENLDTNIGRVLRTLDEEGLRDDTLVVFTSDNGGLVTCESPVRSLDSTPTCNLPLAWGKGWTYEGGTRVSLIARWPKVVPAGRRCQTSTTSTDFYPTFLEACGAPLMPEQHCDGVSLMPLLRGGEGLGREALYWHYPHYSPQGGRPAASILAGDWKLIEYFEDGRVELFNLRDDISETRDLSQAEPERAKQLLAKLKAWQLDGEAQIPKPNPNWREPVRPKIPNNAHE